MEFSELVELTKARAHRIYLDARVVAMDVLHLSGHITTLVLSIGDFLGLYQKWVDWIEVELQLLRAKWKK
jgi:hypothetical protein